MVNQTNNDGNNEKRGIAGEISSEIFGEPIEDAENLEIGNTDEDLLTSLNPDENFESEAISGVQKSLKNGKQHTDTSPDFTSDDIDANWQDNVTSEETSLADNPTPDQDQVDAISDPWGTGYDIGEELDVLRKARKLEQSREDDESKAKE